MTTPEPMRRDEMLEMASLDALGMLEADEAAYFSRSFLEAPRMVQEEIRALQASIASDLRLVSDEEPPAFLRNKVIGAVLAEIDDASQGLEPIATIGALRKARVEKSPLQSNSIRSVEDFDDVEKHLQVERRAIRVRSMNRSLMAWRAASVGLAASLLATFFWLSLIANQAMKITQLAQGDSAHKELNTLLGPSLETFLTASCDYWAFTSTRAELNCTGTLMVMKTGESFFQAYGLPANGEYTLQVKSGDGVTILGKLTGGGKITGARFESKNFQGALELQLVDANKQVVMRGVRNV
jgi:hypothetical protein